MRRLEIPRISGLAATPWLLGPLVAGFRRLKLPGNLVPSRNRSQGKSTSSFIGAWVSRLVVSSETRRLGPHVPRSHLLQSPCRTGVEATSGCRDPGVKRPWPPVTPGPQVPSKPGGSTNLVPRCQRRKMHRRQVPGGALIPGSQRPLAHRCHGTSSSLHQDDKSADVPRSLGPWSALMTGPLGLSVTMGIDHQADVGTKVPWRPWNLGGRADWEAWFHNHLATLEPCRP